MNAAMTMVLLFAGAAAGVASDDGWRPVPGGAERSRTQVVCSRDEGLLKELATEPRPGYSELPVVDAGLLAAAEAAGSEPIRVIIHLDYLPHAVLRDQVRSAHAQELAAVQAGIDAVNARYAAARQVRAPADADNYGSMSEILPADRDELRAQAERHEALSATMLKEYGQLLEAELRPYQAAAVADLEELGATVESTLLTGNVIVALVPGDALQAVTELPRVGRISSDRLRHADLANADDATGVSVSYGLWANGYDGGIYDPAVIDSGTDRTHPGLADRTGRANHWSWYLVAGQEDIRYDWADNGDIDLAGHGTHVAGIVAAYGGTWWDSLGMAYGVQKLLTLKAGWKNWATGKASMYDSDAMNIVERAIHRREELYPVWGTDTYADDVDGFNLSFSGSIDSDEDDYARWVDSVVADTVADTVFTVAAGNSGPDNTDFDSPATSYNAITVAAVDDLNTPSRSDDVLADYSSRGPTNGGRRKPDLAAPGSNICSANTRWETENDYVDGSGTSLAAPMVLGIAMALMDAGVIDELELKALLINTAQKNGPGYDFEFDSDGWDVGMGWGYVNAYAAYYHRFDVRKGSVTPLGMTGHFRLYKGQMRDEPWPGEGRDRATAVWHRHATYEPADYPATYYALADLDLYLYDEDTGTVIDSDTGALDNVHQVRVDSKAGPTDVVVKVAAGQVSFPHGDAEEDFALATEEGFVEVSLPLLDDVQLHGRWPSTISGGDTAEYSVFLTNNGDVALHNVTFGLRTLPAGWSLVKGSGAQNVGSAASGGGTSDWATWVLQAPTAPGVYQIRFDVSQLSYGEYWSAVGNYLPVTVLPDVVFRDGFESGGTGAWSASAP